LKSIDTLFLREMMEEIKISSNKTVSKNITKISSNKTVSKNITVEYSNSVYVL